MKYQINEILMNEGTKELMRYLVNNVFEAVKNYKINPHPLVDCVRDYNKTKNTVSSLIDTEEFDVEVSRLLKKLKK
jgi:hypothetical protein